MFMCPLVHHLKDVRVTEAHALQRLKRVDASCGRGGGDEGSREQTGEIDLLGW